MSSKLILRSITLCGIGPYVEETTLEIKPLTILCGENGTGKSTWLKVLDTLKDSLDPEKAPYFPFQFAGQESVGMSLLNECGLTNYYHYHSHYQHKHENNKIIKEGLTSYIGLHIEVSKGEEFSSSSSQCAENFEEYLLHVKGLNSNKCKITKEGLEKYEEEYMQACIDSRFRAETCIDLRFSLVARNTHSLWAIARDDSSEPKSFVEIEIDKKYKVTFRSSKIGYRHCDSYSVYCDNYFFQEEGETYNHEEVYLAEFNPEEVPFDKHSDHWTFAKIPFENVNEEVGEAQVRRIVKSACSFVRSNLSTVLQPLFHLSAVRTPFGFDGKTLAETRNHLNYSERQKWDAAPKTRYVGMRGEYSWLLEAAYRYNSIKLENGSESKESKLFHEYLSNWTQELLGLGISPSHSIDEVKKLISIEKTAKIRHLIKSHYPDVPEAEEFLEYLGYESFVPIYNYKLDTSFPRKTIAFLENLSPIHGMKYELGMSTEDFSGDMDELEKLRTELSSQCFPGGHSPDYTSSGFKQLFPIILQAALMQQNEILAIENPEVHLHPGLQLKVADFLLRNAKAGKWMFIETHSDLFIRRVLREILEEEIGLSQEKIGIYFTSTVTDPLYEDTKYQGHERDCHHARLERIRVDERGRITNWPKGFMDDDIKESQRLMDIMYGGPFDPTEEDEDDE